MDRIAIIKDNKEEEIDKEQPEKYYFLSNYLHNTSTKII